MTRSNVSLTAEDINRIRRDVPATAQRIHFDNAGSALMPAPVIDAITRHLSLEAEFGGYVAQEKRADALDKAYASMASLLGAKKTEIALLPSATDAWGQAFYSIPLSKGDKIITGFNEYCSSFVACLDRARKTGAEIEVIGTDADGDLDLNALEAAIDDRTKIIAISQVPSSSGQINPVAEVGKIAKAHDVLYLLDACQAVGQLPVNVDAIGCDFLSGTGRKFLRGPRGTGFLYVRESARDKLKPVMLTNQAATWTSADDYELRTDARVFEAWERSVALQLGLGSAADYLMDLGVDAVSARACALATRLRAGLKEIKDVTLCDPGKSLSAIVTFQHEQVAPPEMKEAMAAKSIAIQVTTPFHTRLDLEARGIEAAIRVSPHYYNTEDEVDRFLSEIEAIGHR